MPPHILFWNDSNDTAQELLALWKQMAAPYCRLLTKRTMGTILRINDD